MSDIAEMVGKTPTRIDQSGEEIVFHFTDGTRGRFYHRQDCCESVEVEEVAGDWAVLVGHPVLVAEERTESGDDEEGWGTFTATFYTFRGIGGTVDVRWYGSSNGYYSEVVDFDMEPDTE